MFFNAEKVPFSTPFSALFGGGTPPRKGVGENGPLVKHLVVCERGLRRKTRFLSSMHLFLAEIRRPILLIIRVPPEGGGTPPGPLKT